MSFRSAPVPISAGDSGRLIDRLHPGSKARMSVPSQGLPGEKRSLPHADDLGGLGPPQPDPDEADKIRSEIRRETNGPIPYHAIAR